MDLGQDRMSFLEKLAQINIGLVVLISAVAGVGFLSLYSAAGADINPWASRQLVRYSVSVVGMLIIALIDIKWWLRLAYPIYLLGLFLLILVEIMGAIGMGAQRWINLGFIQLQPSELMKIAVIMALARYFHIRPMDDLKRLQALIMPLILIFTPVAFVMLQPDLGTSLMIIMGGAVMMFLAGVPLLFFMITGAGALASIPLAWFFVLRDYQKQRVLTFLNPESDPLGAGYHITQSKIALGSGGIEGKGFLNGTQSHLNFLPEKQTDFIFTLWAEEFGFIGGVGLLFLFVCIFAYGLFISMRCKTQFSRLLAMGLCVNFSLYVIINIAMVMGLIPVVGVPLPLISYGGTAMLSVMIGFGLMISANIHRHQKLPKYF